MSDNIEACERSSESQWTETQYMFLWDYFIRLGTGRLIHNQKLVSSSNKLSVHVTKGIKHKRSFVIH